MGMSLQRRVLLTDKKSARQKPGALLGRSVCELRARQRERIKVDRAGEVGRGAADCVLADETRGLSSTGCRVVREVHPATHLIDHAVSRHLELDAG